MKQTTRLGPALIVVMLGVIAPNGQLSVGQAGVSKTKTLLLLPTSVHGKVPVDPALFDEALLAALQDIAGFNVLGADDLRAAIDFEVQKQLLGCDQVMCFAEIGGALGAAHLVSVKIGRVGGNRVMLTSKLIANSGSDPTVTARVVDFLPADGARLMQAAPGIVARLFRTDAAPQRRVAPTPTPRGPERIGQPGATQVVRGLQLFRDGLWDEAIRELNAAIQRNPNLAAGHLNLAVWLLQTDAAGAQSHYRRAYSNRAQLSESDSVLLDATEPYMRSPADLGEWARRLRAAAKTHPTDPRFFLYLGFAMQFQGRYVDAADAYEQAINADPAFVPAWWLRGQTRMLMGQTDAAMVAFDECLRVSPAAPMCMFDRVRLNAAAGWCADVLRDARAWTRFSPDSAIAHSYHAEALVAQGANRAAIDIVLQRSWKNSAGGEARARAADSAQLAILEGRFNEAIDHQRALISTLADETGANAQAVAAMGLAEIYLEIGDNSAALEVANNFIRRAPSYDVHPLKADPVVFMHHVRFRARQIDRRQWTAYLKRSLADVEGRHQTPEHRAHVRPRVWLDLFAALALTPAEARHALAKQADFGQLPPGVAQIPAARGELGRLFSLTGQHRKAIPHLRNSASACDGLRRPFSNTRAHFFLGRSLEALGDRAGAKRAYGVVVDRWGNSKSRCAQGAKAGLKRLAGAGKN